LSRGPEKRPREEPVEPDEDRRSTALAFFGASVFLWTAIALIEAGPAYLQGLLAGDGSDAGAALLRSLGRWYSWGLLTPAIFWLARRFPVDRTLWRPFLLVHIPVSLAANAMHVSAWAVVRWLTDPVDGFSFFELLQAYFRGYFAFNLLAYWAILGGAYTLTALRRLHDRELRGARLQARTSRLEAELSRARLAALTARLQPHFLYNTLHTISEIVHTSPGTAERMIVGLGDMLRAVTDLSGSDEVRVSDELDLARAYLAIQQARFGDRLVAEIRADPSTLDATVPLLLIQPLVENAIRHGLDLHGRGRLIVQVARSGSRLVIEIRDSGRGVVGHPTEGIGLGATRSRLLELYGDDHELTLERQATGGTLVRLDLPGSWPDDELAADPMAIPA